MALANHWMSPLRIHPQAEALALVKPVWVFPYIRRARPWVILHYNIRRHMEEEVSEASQQLTAGLEMTREVGLPF